MRLSGERIATILKPVFDWFHGGGVAQISELQAALLPDLPNFTVRYFGRDHPRWLAMRDKLREGAELAPLTAAPGFIDSAPYQNHGLSWLAHLYELGMGGVLADDMESPDEQIHERWRICIACAPRRRRRGRA
ncbi:MAG: hypothetical protein U1F05_03420 [Burkholderiales bacterium]